MTTTGILVTIVTVHPSTVIVSSTAGQHELPAAWFPTTPVAGQEWRLSLVNEPTEPEKLKKLNAFLVRD